MSAGVAPQQIEGTKTGVSSSGNVAAAHLLSTHMHGSKWLTGGSVGPEASVLAFVVLGLTMTLTHFRSNHWADSSTGKAEHNGLTDFGKQVVREMNRIGMIVDVSHVSDKTFYDVLEVSSKPVIASHSSCFVYSDIPRNMKDDMFRALAKNGGVVGVNFSSSFLNQRDADGLKKHASQQNLMLFKATVTR